MVKNKLYFMVASVVDANWDIQKIIKTVVWKK